MLHSIHDINVPRLNSIIPTLQLMEDDPAFLEYRERRFERDEPPPPYSSCSSTREPTPSPFPQTQDDINLEDLFRRPLSDHEVDVIQDRFRGYDPRRRYNDEECQEKKRIDEAWGRRDESYAPLYRGPDLVGRLGQCREYIMIRHSIKKRWQKLGVWNSKWGVPTGELGGFGNNDGPKSWEWESLSQARESAESRAIRLHLQRQGRENENLTPQLQEVGDTTDIQVDDRESLITSRPWFLWALEVAEEAVRLQRNPKQSKIEAYEPARANVTARWKEKGYWKDSWSNNMPRDWLDGWSDLPGWKWKDESPSPEPPDPDEMEFTPSEIDALEAIRPPTPQPQPKSAHPERRPPSPTAHPVRFLFWNSLNAASPCSTEPTANSLTDNEIYAESAQPLLQDYAETPSRTEQRPQSSPATLRKQQRRHGTHRHLTGSNAGVTRSTRLVEVPKKPTRKQRTSQAPTSETSKLAPSPRRSPRIAKRDRHQKDAAAQSDAVKASAIAKAIQQSQLDEDIEETLSCAKRTKTGQLKQRHPRKSSTPLGATKRMARSRNVNA